MAHVTLRFRLHYDTHSHVDVHGRRAQWRPSRASLWLAPTRDYLDVVHVDLRGDRAHGDLVASLPLTKRAQALAIYVFFATYNEDNMPGEHLEGATLMRLSTLAAVRPGTVYPVQMTVDESLSACPVRMTVLEASVPRTWRADPSSVANSMSEWKPLKRADESMLRQTLPEKYPASVRSAEQRYRDAFRHHSYDLLKRLHIGLWRLPTNRLAVPGPLFGRWMPENRVSDEVLDRLIDAAIARMMLTRDDLQAGARTFAILLADMLAYIPTSLPYEDDHVTQNGRAVEIEQFFSGLIARMMDCEDGSPIARLLFDAILHMSLDDHVACALKALARKYVFAVIICTARTASAHQFDAMSSGTKAPIGHCTAMLLNREWLRAALDGRELARDARDAAPNVMIESTTVTFPVLDGGGKHVERAVRIGKSLARWLRARDAALSTAQRKLVAYDTGSNRFYDRLNAAFVYDPTGEWPADEYAVGFHDDNKGVDDVDIDDVIKMNKNVRCRIALRLSPAEQREFTEIVDYMYPSPLPEPATLEHEAEASKVRGAMATFAEALSPVVLREAASSTLRDKTDAQSHRDADRPLAVVEYDVLMLAENTTERLCHIAGSIKAQTEPRVGCVRWVMHRVSREVCNLQLALHENVPLQSVASRARLSSRACRNEGCLRPQAAPRFAVDLAAFGWS